MGWEFWVTNILDIWMFTYTYIEILMLLKVWKSINAIIHVSVDTTSSYTLGRVHTGLVHKIFFKTFDHNFLNSNSAN